MGGLLEIRYTETILIGNSMWLNMKDGNMTIL